MTKPTHNILILGASFAGISQAHYLLRHILPALTAQTSILYKVTLVSPSTQFLYKIGTPRTLVDPSLIPIDQVLLPIVEGFKEYDASTFEFVHGTATKLDPGAKSVRVTGPDEKAETTMNYDSLVIATGTTSHSPIWSLSSAIASNEISRKALQETHASLSSAQTILVGGGGPAGVETAGELGDAFRGQGKQIDILSGGDRLLKRLNSKTAKAAETYLKGMGVNVVHFIRVLEVLGLAEDGRTRLRMSDGTESQCDVYIDATGETPNTEFLPREWLTTKGCVRTDMPTLRVDVQGVKDVYAYGSCTEVCGGGLDINDAVKPLADSIRLDLLAAAADLKSEKNVLPDNEKTPAVSTQQVRNVTWWTWLTSFFSSSSDSSPQSNGTEKRKATYKQNTKELQLVPIGRKGGVGVVFGWRVPSLMVWGIKGRDYMISKASGVVTGADFK